MKQIVRSATEVKELPIVDNLNKQEFGLISKVLYSTRWTGEEWVKTISPLLTKINKIAGELKG